MTAVMMEGALFSADGKVLLLQQRANGNWELPGGELDFGEAPEPALVRIFAEATGIDASVDRPLGAWSELEMRSESTHVIHITFTVRLSGALIGVEFDTEKYSAFVWLNQADAVARANSPAARQIIERAFGVLAKSRKNG